MPSPPPTALRSGLPVAAPRAKRIRSGVRVGSETKPSPAPRQTRQNGQCRAPGWPVLTFVRRRTGFPVSPMTEGTAAPIGFANRFSNAPSVLHHRLPFCAPSQPRHGVTTIRSPARSVPPADERPRRRWRARSRLPVGSSAGITAGCMIVARAIATRWRWPPESWSGRWSARLEAEVLQRLRHARLALGRPCRPASSAAQCSRRLSAAAPGGNSGRRSRCARYAACLLLGR